MTGHNDGLRYDAATNQIWALQNEDANSNLVLVTPGTLAKSAPISVASVNGGGYDDILFQGGNTFISASNPANNPNLDPAIVQATLSGGSVTTSPAPHGQCDRHAFQHQFKRDDEPPGSRQPVADDGWTGGADEPRRRRTGVRQQPRREQPVGRSPFQLQNAMVDDTAFGGTADMTLLVADKATNAIYSVTGPFNPAFGYSAAQNDWARPASSARSTRRVRPCRASTAR